jgi:hypothetical protein
VVITAGGQRIEVEVEGEPIEGELLHKMFARKMIQELEEGGEGRMGPGSEETAIIKDLALKYGLASRLTSFVAVDDATQEEAGEVLVRQVPSMLPAGYGGYGGGGQMLMMCMSAYSAPPGAAPPGAAAPRTLRTLKSSNLMARMCSNVMPLSRKKMSQKSQSLSQMKKGAGSRAGERSLDCMFESADCIMPSSSDEEETYDDMGLDGENEEMSKPKPQTDHDQMMSLIALQTAEGHFKEDKVMEAIFGKTLEELKAKKPDKQLEMKVWLTALVIAFIEGRFPKQRVLWMMIIEKARALVKDPDTITKAEKIFIK